jgi:hypothetical protein
MSEALRQARKVLEEIVGQPLPNKWGYDSAYVAMSDEWRAEARAALALLRASEDNFIQQLIKRGEA